MNSKEEKQNSGKNECFDEMDPAEISTDGRFSDKGAHTVGGPIEATLKMEVWKQGTQERSFWENVEEVLCSKQRRNRSF